MLFFHELRPQVGYLAIVGIIGGLFFSFSTSAALATTYTVNTTADGDDAACTHPYVDANNDCTLHEAIDAANANAGADTIEFNISTGNFADDGDGQFTISLGSAVLPTVTGAVEITGVSMWDSTGTVKDRPGIRVDSTSATTTMVLISGSGANGSEMKAIELTGGAWTMSITSDNITIGTDCDGTNDDKERNVIYGELGDWAGNVYINGGVSTKFRGNYVGIHSDGVTVHTTNLPKGPAAVRINNSTDTIIGYEEGTSSTCAAALQRNVIGHSFNTTLITGSDGYGDGLNINGTTGNLRISGNYIGVSVNGTNIGPYNKNNSATENSGRGIICSNRTITSMFIGTDGDGTDDAEEGNVIGNWGSTNVNITNCGSNIRVSGNSIGVMPNGTDSGGLAGLAVRDDVVVGWCGSSVNATICSDSGTQATQANVIGFFSTFGLSIAANATTPWIYGNAIGTNLAGTADYGNGTQGIVIQQRQTMTPPYYVGGSSSNQRNLIKYNDGGGMYVDGVNKGSTASAITDFRIVNNDISNNGSYGIYVEHTDAYGTSGPTDGNIEDNDIKNNGTYGIWVEGSAPLIDGNTVSGNGSYGMYVTPSEKPDDDVYSNSYDALSPNDASNDIVSRPTITNNTVSNNTGTGLYLLDTKPNNSTWISDNTLSATSGKRAAEQAWYAAVELLDSSNTPITSGSETVSLTPSSTSCSTLTGSVVDSAGGSNAIWASTGTLNYDDASTWFPVTEYVVNSSGTTVDCGAYSVRALGTYTDTTAASYDFNGSNDDTASAGGLANGVSTASIYRYQIAEVATTTDADSDGLTNTTEIALGTDPRDTDSDDDGIDDATETNNGSAINTDSDSTIDAIDTDSDGDTRTDATEGTGDLDNDGTPNYRDTTNMAPSTPINTSPANGTTGTSITPTLIASTFSDPEGDGHGKTKWKIYTTQTGCTERAISGVVDTTSTTSLTSYTVPSTSLNYNTTYWWTVAYSDNFTSESTSSYSTCTSFTTAEEPNDTEEDDADDDKKDGDENDDDTEEDTDDGDDTDDTIAPPAFSGTIPDLSFDEDAGSSWVFDLDDYFTSTEALTYSVSLSSSTAVSVSMSNGEVTMTPWEDWYGSVTMSFTATSASGQTATSNTITVTVNGFNDVPGTVVSGFSPVNGDVTSATSITISWFDSWDAEDGADILSYDIVFGSGDNPFSSTIYTATLTNGVTSISIPLTLENLHTYSYSIETIDSSGARSGWSAIQQFTVDQQLKPALSLTKTIKKIKSEEELRLEQIEAAINNAIPKPFTRRVSHIARNSSSVTLFVLTLLLAGAVVVMRNPRFLFALGMKNPASPFTAMAQRSTGGTYTMSYTQFTGRVHFMRRALIVCGVVALLFVVISYVAEANEDELVVHPGSTVVVAVTYTNSGNGPATNVVINDQIPEHTAFTEENATVRINDTKEELRDADGSSDAKVQFAIGSVAPGASGTVTYRVVADDRLEQESMEFASATTTANELTEGQTVSSNSVSVPVVDARGTVSVRTRDQQPLQDVTVRVYAESITEEHLVTTLITDENGAVIIEQAPAGGYILAVETPTTYNPVSPHTIALSYDTEASATIIVTRQGEQTEVAGGVAEQQNIPFEDAVILNTLPSLTTAQTAWTAEQSQLVQSAMIDAVQNRTVPLQIETVEGVPLPKEETTEGVTFVYNEQYGVRDLLQRWTRGAERTVVEGTVVIQGTVALPSTGELPSGDHGGMVMRVSILPDIIVQSALYDTANNVWAERIPANTLQPDVAHVVYGELSTNGQSSGVVSLGRFAVRENVSVPLATVLMLLNWLVLSGLLIYVVGYMVVSPFRRQRTPTADAVTIDTANKNQ